MKAYLSDIVIAAVLAKKLNSLATENYYATTVRLDQLKARMHGQGLVDLSDTPHFKYFKGNKEPYTAYIEKYHVNEIKQSLESIENLQNENSTYPMNSDGLCCPILIDSSFTIIDGVHRASRLLTLSAEWALVLQKREGFVNWLNPENDKFNFEEHLSLLNKSVKEWYSPLIVDNKVLIPHRSMPNFVDRWEADPTDGMNNWNNVIAHVLPSLSNKIIFDLGSSIGQYSLRLSELGAKLVVGIDRGPHVFQPNNRHLGIQSVANQAYGVLKLEEKVFSKKFENVYFLEMDLNNINLVGQSYDVLFSARCLYHLGRDKMTEIIKQFCESSATDLILQANNGQPQPLGETSSISFHVKLLSDLGLKIVNIIALPNNPHPILHAQKK